MKISFLALFLILFISPFLINAAGQIDINTATLAQLDELTGIGPSKAQSIIGGRPYSSLDDLLRVKGIGESTLQKIKDQGVACANCTTQIIIEEGPSTEPLEESNLSEPISYISGIFINEILPSPKGADDTDEFIEIYNSNNLEVDLSGWSIEDINGSVNSFNIPAGTKILANGFLTFYRPQTKIMLNNDSDGLNFFSPDKKLVDSISYIKAPTGQSYNKTSSDWKFSATLTPGTINVITSVISRGLSKTKKSVNNELDTQALADISKALGDDQVNNNIKSPWFLFFIVLATTIILAALTLFIKLRVGKKENIKSES